ASLPVAPTPIARAQGRPPRWSSKTRVVSWPQNSSAASGHVSGNDEIPPTRVGKIALSVSRSLNATQLSQSWPSLWADALSGPRIHYQRSGGRMKISGRGYTVVGVFLAASIFSGCAWHFFRVE